MLRRFLSMFRRKWETDAVIEYEGKVIYRLPPPLSDNPSRLMFTQPKSGSKMVRASSGNLRGNPVFNQPGLEGLSSRLAFHAVKDLR